MSGETILVVDDEPAIIQVVRDRLRGEGFVVRSEENGEQALASVAEDAPDLIILDLQLPDLDGFEVLRRLRQAGCDEPVIVLTARDDDVDMIVGLELGADDYVIKPFNPRALVARVRAVLRRRAETRSLAGRVAHLETQLVTPAADPAPSGEKARQDLRIDTQARRAWYHGEPLELRSREYDLLLFLAQHPRQVLSRASLLDRVWGISTFIDERTVDVHVHRLRSKLAEINAEHEPIRTERGIGYRWEP